VEVYGVAMPQAVKSNVLQISGSCFGPYKNRSTTLSEKNKKHPQHHPIIG
jgi:hypothetical protein